MCLKNTSGQWITLVHTKKYTQNINGIWLDSNQKQANPIQHDTEYLTEKGAAQHPYWIYAYNEKAYHVYPISNVNVIPHAIATINLANYKYLPVTIIDGKLVELDSSAPPLYTAFSNYEADWDENIAYALEAIKSPEPDAAIKLLGLMSDISEECHYASWLTGNEHALLKIINEYDNSIIKSVNYGIGKVSATQILELQRLKVISGGWWYWDIDDELRFIKE